MPRFRPVLRRALPAVPRHRFTAVAGTALIADLATKEVAVRVLGDDRLIGLTDRLHLVLVWNTGAVGGMSMGPTTTLLNALLTLLAILLIASVMEALTTLDRRAVLPLGMVAGGAVGNLASIVAGPTGVADFIAMRLWGDLTIVANVADFMLWGGVLLLTPILAKLVGRLRAGERLLERPGAILRTRGPATPAGAP